jgi:hypothetical protein
MAWEERRHSRDREDRFGEALGTAIDPRVVRGMAAMWAVTECGR